MITEGTRFRSIQNLKAAQLNTNQRGLPESLPKVAKAMGECAPSEKGCFEGTDGSAPFTIIIFKHLNIYCMF